MNKIVLLSLLLSILLAGCSDEEDSDPYSTVMGYSVESNYEGSSRGDDDDLYFRVAFPDYPEERGDWRKLSPGGNVGTSWSCRANQPEWEGKWWMEMALYEEIEGEPISREHWNIDCVRYWITIDAKGQMELHEGDPPWDRPRDTPGFGWLTLVVGLGVALASHMDRRARGL